MANELVCQFIRTTMTIFSRRCLIQSHSRIGTAVTSLLFLSSSFGKNSGFVSNNTMDSQQRPGLLNSVKTASNDDKDATTNDKQPDSLLPTMIVFDLDDCLWSPEMHELPSMPSIPVEGDLLDGKGTKGIVGLKVPRSSSTVYLFEGARRTLLELATNQKYDNILLATASSSLEPTYSYACLKAIEILPGLTLSDMFRYNQIGRTGQLSPRKTSHFTNLHEESGVPFEEMLFFDDCNWGDHCATVSRAFGVVSYRTPNGLQYHEFEDALAKYREEALKRQSASSK